MLDLNAIKARAAARLDLEAHSATPANAANAANDAVAQAPEAGPISQLATLATLAKRDPRAYRLTKAEADTAHADPWDEAAIARFQARKRQIQQHGFNDDDSDDLAERLHLRDAHADYRHLCLECRHYRRGRCGNHRAAGLTTAEVARDLTTMFQHCPGFAELPV